MFMSKINVPAASGSLTNIPGCIRFWSLRDTTVSSGSVFELWDGSGVGGQYVGSFSTTAGQSFRDFIDEHALPFDGGLYYSLLSGSIVGQITVDIGHPHNHNEPRPVFIVASEVEVATLGLGS